MMNDRLFHLIGRLLFAFLLLPSHLCAQVNTDRVMAIGRNALYFEDYALSIQYFNQVIGAKPYLCEPYFFRALAKLNLEDYVGAEEDCTHTIECNPFVVNAYQVRGLARINLDNFAGAIADYRFALKYDPENVSVLHNLSLCYMSQKDYAHADSTLDYLMKVSPNYDRALLLKSQVAVEAGDTLKALRYADRAVEKDPYDADFWSVRALLRLSQKDFKNAEEDFTNAIRLGVNNASNYINRALARYNQNNLRGAMSDYDEALDIEPKNYIGLYNRGLLRAMVGDDNRAIEDFDQVVNINPDNMMAIFNRALLRDKTGDYEGAIDDCSKVLAKYPNFAYGYRCRADIYKKVGKKQLATLDEDKLLRMALDEQFGKKDKNKGAKETRKQSDEDVNNYQKIVVADESEISKYNDENRGRIQDRNVSIKMQPMVTFTYYEKPDELNNHILYHKCLEEMNRSADTGRKLLLTTRERPLTEGEAASHFESINERNVAATSGADCAKAKFLRAIDFYLVQDFENAINDLTDAITCAPASFQTYFMRAVVQCKELEYERSATNESFMASTNKNAGEEISAIDYDRVRKDMDKVVELAPDFAYGYYNRACVEASLKDFIGALADLDKAIAIDSDFAEAYYNRGLIHVFLGNNKQGIADLSRAGELGLASSYNVIKRFSPRK